MTTNLTSLVSASFRWNGSSSDIAQQLLRRYLANATAPTLSLSNTTLPHAIQMRLDRVNATFSQLPGLLQRALVWDSGYVVTERNELVQVITMSGISMAQLAISTSQYDSTTGCKAQNCTASDGTIWYKHGNCNTPKSIGVLCVVETFESAAVADKSAWSTGGEDTDIPMIRVLKHSYADGGWKAFAIHTAGDAYEPLYNQCSIKSGGTVVPSQGSLVIPCGMDDWSGKASFKAPAQGKIVTPWLEAFMAQQLTPPPSPTLPTDASSPVLSTPSPTAKNKTNVVVIIVPIVIVVLLLVAGMVWYRRRAKGDKGSTSNHFVLNSPQQRPQKHGFPSNGTEYIVTGSSGTTSSHRSGDTNHNASYNAAWKLLVDDMCVMDKKLAYQQIEFADPVSKGAYGEVWVGYYNEQIVALKRLLPSKNQSPKEVEAFALEIQLSARLHHPNIVRFIGVAWNTLDDLVMVLEYLPAGDLTKVLRSSGDQLTWQQHKLGMARGLFSAVAYLHAQSPEIIHRDIKSKNVLLSDALEPKLIDFGVSRRQVDETMTAGVGTPYWTAPEVLEGKRYTEKSDIYSLGVVLTELDTHKIPYHDVKTEEGGSSLMKIVTGVVAGKLRPTITESCPEVIRKVICDCLQQDPVDRPSAQQVLFTLA